MTSLRHRSPRDRMTLDTLLPGLGWTEREWREEELPALVRLCGGCGGKGISEQTYTAGCGGGSYRSKGKCDWCAGVGLHYLPAPDRYGRENPIPVTVVNMILVARDMKVAA